MSVLPHLAISYRTKAEFLHRGDSLVEKDGLQITADNYYKSVSTYSNPNHILLITGHPIFGDRIHPDRIWEEVQSRDLTSGFLRKINGEFLILHLNRKSSSLKVANDRFAAIPTYYISDEDRFVASLFYNDLWLWLRNNQELEMDRSGFFQFLWLQRLVGESTYDNSSKFLPPATLLEHKNGEATLEKFWTPDFTSKTKKPVREAASELAHLIQQSIDRKTSDDVQKIGHFLSGGTDSRTVLAGFQEKLPTCFTVSRFKNIEYEAARGAAEIAGANHVFLELNEDPFSHRIDRLVKLNGGMYKYTHAIFEGFREQIQPEADVVFHGHGIDYMFQGMYVQQRPLQIGSVTFLTAFLRKLDDDVATEFLNNIEYRLSDVNLLDYTVEGYKDSLYDSLYGKLQKILEEGTSFCNSNYDLWEYLLTHSISRHYSYPNMLSMETNAEQRTITFDNDIFDFYQSLPVKYRKNGKIARLTLMELNPAIAQIKTGNENLPANMSPLQKDLYRVWKKFLEKTRLGEEVVIHPDARQRTWPDMDEMVRNQTGIKNHAQDLCESEALASLDFLDMDKLSKDIKHWLEQPSGGGHFMNFLITIDRFLKQ